MLEVGMIVLLKLSLNKINASVKTVFCLSLKIQVFFFFLIKFRLFWGALSLNPYLKPFY